MLVLCLIVFVAWAAVVDDPLGGEPMVVVSADARGTPAKKADETTPGGSQTAAKADPKADPKGDAKADPKNDAKAAPSFAAPHYRNLPLSR